MHWGSLEGGDQYRNKENDFDERFSLDALNANGLLNLRDSYHVNKKSKDAKIQQDAIFGYVKNVSVTDDDKTIVDALNYDECLDQVLPVSSAIADKAYEGGDGGCVVDGVEYKRTD